MKKILLSLFSFTITFTAFSQTKMLTMEEAVLKQKKELAPKRLSQLGWIPGTDNYYFIEGKKKDSLMMGSVEKGKAELKATLKQINTAIKKFGMGMDTLNAIPVIKWENKTKFTFDGKSRIFYSLIDGGHSGTVLDKDDLKGSENSDEQIQTGNIAFTKENNLFAEINSPSTHDIQITNDVDINIVNGKSVHREEWGISKGTFWSPQGNYLAFYRMDQTMVADYPIVDYTKQPAKLESIKYPMAGGKSHEVTVGVYDLKTKKTIFLKTGEPKDQYLINPCWTPDEKHIYVTILNRDQNYLKLNSYNAQTGEFEKTLFEEKNPKYVHPMNPPLFVKEHPDLFIWQSERDGYNNLYLYKTDGTLLRPLTSHEIQARNSPFYYSIITEVLGFDEKGDHVYYIAAHSENILGRDIRVCAIDGSSDIALTKGNGIHSAILSPTGKYLIDTYSSPTVPRIISIIDVNGKVKQTLLDATNPLKDYKLGQIKIIPMIAADNRTQLFLRITYPVDFDSTKKYPVIDYMYNGPNVQLVNNSWLNGSDLWFQYMAEHGYIVLTMDGRGSGFRGLEFEQCTFGHLGNEEINDQLKAVDYLKTKKYVDVNRIGVFGWSFGGFMSTSLMTRSDVFKVGVAGGPVIDWSYYEVMYTERYMDTPQTNKLGYEGNCLLNYAQNLKGKLLMIHGTSDPVVMWQNSLIYIRKCIDLGKQIDYFVYPGDEHNMFGKDRVHLYEKVTEYFENNL